MQETKVIARDINSKYFSYIADEGATERDFVAEASDIPGGARMFLSQAWNDACDVGFNMVSQRTGKKVLFCMEKEMTDREGEVYGWQFTGLVDFNHGVITQDLKAVIFND